MLCLPLMVLAAYHFVPVNPPKLKHTIPSVVICILFYMVFSTCFTLIINPGRYSLIYGALGRLFLFLINVYFFFLFFFFGAQMILVLDFSDALLFIRYRTFHSRRSSPSNQTAGENSDKVFKRGAFRRIFPFSPNNKLFSSVPGPLEKYLRTYKKGETVITQGSRDKESYYIISGRVGVYLDIEFKKRVALIETAHFFGEMETITSEERVASIRAETDLTVLRLPPELFHTILRFDPDTDQNIIKTLSERLKSLDKQVI